MARGDDGAGGSGAGRGTAKDELPKCGDGRGNTMARGDDGAGGSGAGRGMAKDELPKCGGGQGKKPLINRFQGTIGPRCWR